MKISIILNKKAKTVTIKGENTRKELFDHYKTKKEGPCCAGTYDGYSNCGSGGWLLQENKKFTQTVRVSKTKEEAIAYAKKCKEGLKLWKKAYIKSGL